MTMIKTDRGAFKYKKGKYEKYFIDVAVVVRVSRVL
jgi:hypothetical protein